jgi:hypothetical protein
MHRAALLLGITLICAIAPANGGDDPFVNPALIQIDGVTVGVAWNPTGPTEYRRYRHYTVTIPIGGLGNVPMMSFVIDSLCGSKLRRQQNMMAIQKAAQNPDGTYYGVALDDVFVTGLELPAFDATSRRQDVFLVYESCTVRSMGNFIVPKNAAETAKKEKLWTASNFRLKIDGMPTGRVAKGSTVRLGGTPEIDAFVSPPAGASPLTFTIPREDAQPFRDWLAKNVAGEEVYYNLQLDYLDDLGTTLLSVQSPVTVVSVDWSMPLIPVGDPDNMVQVVVKFPGDKIPIIKGAAM